MALYSNPNDLGKTHPNGVSTLDTAILPDDSNRLEWLLSKSNNQSDMLELTNDREVVVMVRGIAHRFVFDVSNKLIIGRNDLHSGLVVDLDLMPFGAMQRGVSRLHAQLTLTERGLFIADMGSTNGTFLNGDRLKPNRAYRVTRGSEIVIGQLPVQIFTLR